MLFKFLQKSIQLPVKKFQIEMNNQSKKKLLAQKHQIRKLEVQNDARSYSLENNEWVSSVSMKNIF
jgi:hypothetical protein